MTSFNSRELEIAILERIMSKEQVQVTVVPAIFQGLPEIKVFTEPHQSKSVIAGATETVFQLLLEDDCTGFIQQIGNEYFRGDIVRFLLDGQLPFTGNIERIIGHINSPMTITPWHRMKFTSSIMWKVTNMDTEAHHYEILCDGFYVKNSDLPKLFQLNGSVV